MSFINFGKEVIAAILLFLLLEFNTGSREFRIAWMAPAKDYYGLSAASSVGGLKIALYAMEKQGYPLTNHTIKVKWYDSDCNSKSALAAAVDAKEAFEPDLFLGPPCSAAMKGVAQLASHWNIPVFGWVSSDIEFDNRTTYSTLIRLLGPLNRFPTIMIHITSMFKWKLFAMLSDDRAPYQEVAEAIKRGDKYNIKSSHLVNPSMSDDQVKKIFELVSRYSRIIILAVPWVTMRKYMLVAHRLGMTNGDFAFICIHGDLYTWEVLETDILSDYAWRRNDSYDEDARLAFEPVLHIIMDTLQQDRYKQFKKYTLQYANHNNKLWQLPKVEEPDAYAPYLYDATLVWALLVDKALKNNEEPDGMTLMKKAPDFYAEGVTGYIVLDKIGDRFLNFWFMDMQEDGTFNTIMEIRYNKSGTIPEYDVSPYKVRWPNGKTGLANSPPDIPVCGFDGEYCPEEKDDNTSVIVLAVAGSSLVLVIAVIFNIVLRRYRRHKLLKSMLWQIRFEEIDFVTALLNGSVRASFKNLARRISAQKQKARSNGTSIYLFKGSPDQSPITIQSHKTEHGDMFGSVAYVRGSLVSVKRMAKNSVNVTKDVLHELNQLMELKHQNVCAFVGACVDPGRILLFWEYCPKGSLQDVIWNQNIKLDRMFMFALTQDVAKGLEFIHKCAIHHHGNLKSSNCVVDSRWTCKLTDFGVQTIRSMDKCSTVSCVNDDNSCKLIWTAPEILRFDKIIDKQKADVFSLGIIMKEVFTRSGPYTEYPFLSSNEIVNKVKDRIPGFPAFRPMISRELRESPDLVALIEECWNEDPLVRPSAARSMKTLNRINPSKNMTMIDNMIAILEKYANHLEELVAERTSELDVEKQKTENLLYRMLPQSVAEDLKQGKTIKAEHYDEATIYFSDIVGFTTICADSTPIEVVNLLNSLYTLFDDIITKYDVYKVETIGDAYMLASGLPNRNGTRHIREIADCALDILASVATFCIPHQPGKNLRIRVGIHSGPVVAGVVGLAMPRYCLFGDTVNTASRMESTGLPLKIHLSTISKENLEKYPGYHLHCRGEITVKGKGIMKTYFLCGKDGFSKSLPACDEENVSVPVTISTVPETIRLKLTEGNVDMLNRETTGCNFVTRGLPDPDKDSVSQEDVDMIIQSLLDLDAEEDTASSATNTESVSISTYPESAVDKDSVLQDDSDSVVTNSDSMRFKDLILKDDVENVYAQALVSYIKTNTEDVAETRGVSKDTPLPEVNNVTSRKLSQSDESSERKLSNRSEKHDRPKTSSPEVTTL